MCNSELSVIWSHSKGIDAKELRLSIQKVYTACNFSSVHRILTNKQLRKSEDVYVAFVCSNTSI